MEITPYGLLEQGGSLEQLLNMLTPFGYRLYDERSEAPLSSNPAALERMIGEGASRNWIARVALNRASAPPLAGVLGRALMLARRCLK